MTKDPFAYQDWTVEALRGVVRRALKQVARHGVRGNHQFYLCFRTDYAGVTMPEWLRERYPREITVVIEHEFWDLEVHEEWFCVTLSFSDVRCPLEVPFAAIVSFADPPARFGLQFNAEGENVGVHGVDLGRPHDEAKSTTADSETLVAPDDGGPGDAKAGEAGDAPRVVSLDAFRNKK